MLEILSYFGYSLLSFAIGGIMFKSKDAKNITKDFKNFKNEKEQEIFQINQSKEKQQLQVQQLTKANSELKKQYNRASRNIELLELQLTEAQKGIDKKIGVGIDNYFKDKK